MVSADERNQILLVEDDMKLASLVCEYLTKNGYQVTCEHRGDRAIAAIEAASPDLVILDVMLPGKDGISICHDLRPQYRGAILMLTARGEELDEVLGLDAGADDYLAKPVRPRVLLARIRALLRRQSSAADAPQRIEIGALLLDSGNRSVQLGDADVELTGAEFDLLWALAANAGRPMSRDLLSEATRGTPYDGLDRTIDLRIASLRSKLGDTSKPPSVILSIRGVGYQLATGSSGAS